MRLFFTQGPVIGIRLVICGLLSFALMTWDHHTRHDNAIRYWMQTVVSPFHFVVDRPILWIADTRHFLQRQVKLLKRNQELEQELQLAKAKNLVTEALRSENTRLRRLLKARAKKGEDLQVAEVIQVSTDPFVNQLVINHGAIEGVHLGQGVLDVHGVVGQVITVYPHTAVVLLLNDALSSVPVQDNRSGARALLGGVRGASDGNLRLMYVTSTADFKEKDTLVTSGLGGHFPAGSPVGDIVHIERNMGEAFIEVIVKPRAKLDSVREVLLASYQESSS